MPMVLMANCATTGSAIPSVGTAAAISIEMADGVMFLQALGIAWDSRAQRKGGRAVFHLYPDEVMDFRHPPALDGARSDLELPVCRVSLDRICRRTTTWSPDGYRRPGRDQCCLRGLPWPWLGHIDGHGRCESGQQIGGQGLPCGRSSDRDSAVWTVDWIGEAAPQPRVNSRAADRLCARSHSRRGMIWDDYRFGEPLTDTHRLAACLTMTAVRVPDGPDQGVEVYVPGSFLQRQDVCGGGVTCSDCHEPHSLKLRAEGTRFVHAPYHGAVRHPGASTIMRTPYRWGAPARMSYMPAAGLHGQRLARRSQPARAASRIFQTVLGTPNATCSTCHADKDLAGRLRQWQPGIPTADIAVRISARPCRQRSCRAAMPPDRLPGDCGPTDLCRASRVPPRSDRSAWSWRRRNTCSPATA